MSNRKSVSRETSDEFTYNDWCVGISYHHRPKKGATERPNTSRPQARD